MNTDRLRRKIYRWLDGVLAPKEVRSLESELKQSAAARSEYLAAARIHAELCNRAKEHELLDSMGAASTMLPVEPAQSGITQAGSDNQYSPRPWTHYVVAASLAIGFGLWWALQAGIVGGLQSGHLAERGTAVESPTILVALEPQTDRCEWYVEELSRTVARSYQSGDVIRVTSGDLSLVYANGTKVVLRSPAAYQLLSGSQARMIIGRLTATVPDAGKGFTVITPQANVIDLGTEFGVEVNNDGATDVVVFKGEVDVDYHNGATQVQRLQMGEAVRLDAIGTTSRLVSVNGDSYFNHPDKMATRQPLIAEVCDNIERDSSMLSFYEVVPEGMTEDALAYVDRAAHQYNGISHVGMPEYLLDGDYVKMFNNDKYLKSIRVEVALSSPANLYILLDNRQAPPEWLAREFRDTGDDIGLDNGPFQTKAKGRQWHNKGPSGVGPGESVDDELSVWVRTVPRPGVVHLGSLGTSTEVGANMYGIVATPLGSPEK